MSKFFRLVNGEYLPVNISEIAATPLVKFLKESFYQLPDGTMVKSAVVPTLYPEQLDEFTNFFINAE
ncbi:hypothetical protein D3C78_965090 [compost metagenome]